MVITRLLRQWERHRCGQVHSTQQGIPSSHSEAHILDKTCSPTEIIHIVVCRDEIGSKGQETKRQRSKTVT